MKGELVMEPLQVALIRSASVYRNFQEAKDSTNSSAKSRWMTIDASCHNWFSGGRVADTEWKPLPAGLWTLPAVFMEAGNLLLEAFMEAGVPTLSPRRERCRGVAELMVSARL
jgi:hypothetical protein